MKQKLLPPPPDPTYTQIPHQMIRNLSFFTPPEVMVLLVAFDLTIGYHRKTAQPMSYRWVAEQTGLAKTTVENAIKSLIVKGWISESKKRGKRGVKLYKPVTSPVKVGYDADYDKSSVPANGTVTVPANGTVVSQQMGQHKDSSKDSPVKEKKDKGATPKIEQDPFALVSPVFTPESRTVLRHWKESTNAIDPQFTKDKRRAEIALMCIEALGVERTCELMTWAANHDFPGYSSQLTNMFSVRDKITTWDKIQRRESSNAAQTFNAYPYVQFDGEGEGGAHE